MGNNCCNKKIAGAFSDNLIESRIFKQGKLREKHILFKFELKGKKVNSIKFAESHVKKEILTKDKKRLLVELNDNSLFIVSFYIEKLMFLTTAIEIKEKYRLLSANFISINHSKYYCLVLISDGEIHVVIVGLYKIDSNSKKNDCLSNSYSDLKNQPKDKNDIDVFLNSVESTILMKDTNSKKKSSTSTKNPFFKELAQTKIYKVFELFNLSKYKSYCNKVLLNFAAEFNYSSNIQVKINNFEIYILSEISLKCFKINESFNSYSELFNIDLSISYDNLFPIEEGLYILTQDCYISLFTEKHLQTVFNINNVIGSDKLIVSSIRLSDYVYTIQSMNPSEKETIMISMVIAGNCAIPDKNQKTQFLSIINFGGKHSLNAENFKDKSCVRTISSELTLIESIKYGPYNNGPVLTGHLSGQICIWNTNNLSLINVFCAFQSISVNILTNEPNGMSILCNKEKAIFKFFHAIDRKRSIFLTESNHKVTILETKHSDY